MFDVRIFKNAQHFAGVARDVTAERMHASHLEIQATIDPLAGAYNRGQLEVLLTQSIRSARRRKTTGCFIFLDIDDFKSINDSFGHDVGDRVLKEIVSVLETNLRDSDVIGRLGGDEFAAILTDATSVSGPIKAEQLAVALGNIVIKGHDSGVNVSIGLAVFPEKGERALDVIKRADAAMYQAKRVPGQNVQVWESE